jgi:hypothetical protein
MDLGQKKCHNICEIVIFHGTAMYFIEHNVFRKIRRDPLILQLL